MKPKNIFIIGAQCKRSHVLSIDLEHLLPDRQIESHAMLDRSFR